jgi:hypothetical protein
VNSSGTAPNFCAECGAAIKGGKFCSNCGTPSGVFQAIRPPVAVAAEEKAAELPVSGDGGVESTLNGSSDVIEAAAAEDDVAPPTTGTFTVGPSGSPASPPPRRGRRDKPRGLLIGSIVAAAVAVAAVIVAVVVMSGDSKSDSAAKGTPASAYKQQVAKVFGPVLGANLQLSDTLTALRGTDSTDAQVAVSRAQRAATVATGGLSALTVPAGSETFASQARQALDRETAYLSAVSTVLENPSVTSATQLQTLSSNLSTALDAAGPAVAGSTQTVSGADTLTAWAHTTSRTLRKRAAAKKQAAAKRKAAAKKKAQSNGASSGANAPAPVSSGTNCGGGVFAGPNTSCTFAVRVRDAYFDAPGSVASVRVFSPVTGQVYTMNCRPSGSGTTCSGGNNASVTF